MKKYIIRLAICLILLIGLLFLAMVIRNKVDQFVDNKVPVQDTTVTLDTGAFIVITDPSSLEESEGSGNGNNSGNGGNSGGNTTPSSSTEPSNPNDSTNPSTGTDATNPSSTSPTSTTPTTVPTTTAPKGQTVPPIVFYTRDDGAVTLEIYKDKPVIVCLWASWATGSEATLDLLEEAYNLHSDKLYVVAINLTSSARETKEDAQAFWDSHNYSFPTYYDNDGTCQALFEVNTVPTTFFLRENNRAIAYFKGKITRYGLRLGLDALLPKR